MPPSKPVDRGPLDALTLIAEVGMFALLVAVGTRFAPGWQGWLVGALIALVALAIFVQWSSENSPRRLEQPVRLGAQIVMFLTVALYSAAAGLLVWGAGLAVFAITVFGLQYRRGR